MDEKGHATDLITEEAIRFLSAERKGPFFLWVAFSVPHYPLQEEDRWLAPYKGTIKDPSRRLYAASVSHMDAAVGRIVAALEKSGQLDNTLIVFTSDNGGQRDYRSKTDYGGKHGPYPTLGDNRPLRGWKGDQYEGGIRVPAFAYWRGRLQPRVVRETVSYLDWMPTLTHLAGAKCASHGRDVWPLLEGKRPKQPAVPLYWNVGRTRAVLDGDWKLIVSQRKGAPAELYNLAVDPAEKKNVAGENPEQVKRLRRILEEQAKLDPPR